MLSALIIVAVSEVAKRSSLLGAALASLPLTSLLAFVWLYLDTGDTQKDWKSVVGYFLAGVAFAAFVFNLAVVAESRLGILVESGSGCRGNRGLLWHDAAGI